jgi:hypothetical protein
VPPSQAEAMHAALKAKGIPTAIRMYPSPPPPGPLGFNSGLKFISELPDFRY